MRMSFVVALAAGLAAVACQQPAGSMADGVTLSVLQPAYTAGDTLEAELSNSSQFTVGFNLCYTNLDRRTSSGWREVDAFFGIPGNAGCADILAALESGATAQYRQQVPVGLAPGTYRLRSKVVVGDDGRTLVTQSFEIRG